MTAIFIIFIVVVAVVVAEHYIRRGLDKARLRKRLIRRSIADAEREERMKGPWPPIGGAIA